MRRVTVGAVVWLTTLWVLLWNDISAANVMSGVVLAVVVLASSRLASTVCVGSDNGDRPEYRRCISSTSWAMSWCSWCDPTCSWPGRS